MDDKSNQNQDDSSEDSSSPNYGSARYWIRRAKEHEKVFKKRWWKYCDDAWAEYQLGESRADENDGGEEGTGERQDYAKLFPIYYSSIKTLAPAYWSKIPIPIAPVRYGVNDGVARTGAKLMERMGIYSLETTPLDEVMRDSTIEYINSDGVTTRVMLEGDRKTRQVPIMPLDESGQQFQLQSGQPYTGKMIGQDEGTGAWFGEETYYENLRCYPMALSYGDYMWTMDASCKDEIDEMYYRFCYAEHEAYEMFPDIEKETLRSCMKVYGKQKKNSENKVISSETGGDGTQDMYLHGWEIWHKKTKTVKFICNDYKDGFLKETKDTYMLRDFFPSPCPIVGTKQRKSLFGIPAFRYIKSMCEEMHDVSCRIYQLSQAIRPRFVVDKNHETDLYSFIQDSEESEYIFIKNMMEIVEKGGLQNVIQALPVGDLSNALIQLSQLFEKYKQEFYEIYGIPDVLRGASDPLETAKAQEIKSFSASNRFRDQMNQIAELGRATLELLIDLKFGAYTQENVFRICGVQFMDPADQERINEAYQLVMNDNERFIRIDFETDSTSYINEQIEQQNRNVAIQTVTEGMRSLREMSPLERAVGFKVIQSALAGQRLGKEYMDDIENLMQKIMEEAQKPQEPAPDVEMLKLEQKAQKDQIDAFMRNRELDQKEAKLASDAQKEYLESQLKAREVELKSYKLMLEEKEITNDERFETVRLALEDVSTRFMMAMEEQKFSIEKFKAFSQAIESQREEIRLAREASINVVKAASEFEKRAEPQVIHMAPPEMPPIELIMPERKKRRRVVQPIDDGVGGTRFVIDEEDLD